MTDELMGSIYIFDPNIYLNGPMISKPLTMPVGMQKKRNLLTIYITLPTQPTHLYQHLQNNDHFAQIMS
jgi:hypothetical protein